MNPANFPQSADPLADLRGYHLPDPVSWWPPAPGWWVVALLGLGCLIGLGLWQYRRYRSRAAIRQALAELDRLEARYREAGDPSALARGLSRLVRRVVLGSLPRERAAGLTGDAWLAFLDAQGGEGRFSQGPGRLLRDAPYRPHPDPEVRALIPLIRTWLRRFPGREGHD